MNTRYTDQHGRPLQYTGRRTLEGQVMGFDGNMAKWVNNVAQFELDCEIGPPESPRIDDLDNRDSMVGGK